MNKQFQGEGGGEHAAASGKIRIGSGRQGRRSPHILVTGSHRSGTTWVGRTISRHPSVRYIDEPFNVTNPNFRMALKLDTWFTHFASSDRKDEIRDAFDRILEPRSAGHYALDVCRAAGPDLKAPLRFGKHYLLAAKRPRALVKDPLALLSAEWLHERYGMQVVCTVRSPVAFVGSVKVAGWDVDFDHFRRQKALMQGMLAPYAGEVNRMCEGGGDFIDHACLLWNILHSAILVYQEKFPSWLFVKYEDVASEPLLEFDKMFNYLRLEMDDRIRQYIVDYTSQKNAATSATTAYQPRNAKESLGTWKERLSPEEVTRVKNATEKVASLLYGNV